jgi:hypothetical protein
LQARLAAFATSEVWCDAHTRVNTHTHTHTHTHRPPARGLVDAEPSSHSLGPKQAGGAAAWLVVW